MEDKSFKLWQFLIYAAVLIIAQTIGATVWVSNVDSDLNKMRDNEKKIKMVEDKQDSQDDSIKEIRTNLKKFMEEKGFKWIPVE